VKPSEAASAIARSMVRAGKGYALADFVYALAFALTAFKMHLRGWRTDSWHLPSTDGRTHDCRISFWNEPVIRTAGMGARQRRQGWQPGRKSESYGRWFKSIWTAVKFAEDKAGRKRP